MSQSIESTLTERGSNYGSFDTHAEITQQLKEAVREKKGWHNLSDDQKEAFDMIFHKMGRIINGNPNFHDSWHDIVGYAKLVADSLVAK
jgi:hypothetical protein